MVLVERFGQKEKIRMKQYKCEYCDCIFYSDEEIYYNYDIHMVEVKCPCCEELIERENNRNDIY